MTETNPSRTWIGKESCSGMSLGNLILTLQSEFFSLLKIKKTTKFWSVSCVLLHPCSYRSLFVFQMKHTLLKQNEPIKKYRFLSSYHMNADFSKIETNFSTCSFNSLNSLSMFPFGDMNVFETFKRESMTSSHNFCFLCTKKILQKSSRSKFLKIMCKRNN